VFFSEGKDGKYKTLVTILCQVLDFKDWCCHIDPINKNLNYVDHLYKEILYIDCLYISQKITFVKFFLKTN
jgi:hypothetical protein